MSGCVDGENGRLWQMEVVAEFKMRLEEENGVAAAGWLQDGMH